MAKYSTGEGGGGAGGSCELCGREDVALETATVAGATLEVCANCAGDHGEGPGSVDQQDGDDRPPKRTARNAARIYDAASHDASQWEDGADYDDDQLPYLVRGYGDRLVEARQDAGLQREELAAELEVDPAALLAVEQGRATQAGVGGSTITAIEEHLDVELTESG